MNGKALSSKKHITQSAVFWVLLGLALLLLFLILEGAFFEPTPTDHTQHLGKSILHAVVRLLELTGVACFVLGLIHIMVETEGWSDYFRERIQEIVLQQSYLNTLDKDRLTALQASLLKAQFKDPHIDREGSFFNYLNTNLHPYLASPYREDVSAEAIYSEAGDSWEVFDRVTFICKKAASGIQGNLEQYSLSAISALAERAVAALVPR
jgi:hypothetical protein